MSTEGLKFLENRQVYVPIDTPDDAPHAKFSFIDMDSDSWRGNASAEEQNLKVLTKFSAHHSDLKKFELPGMDNPEKGVKWYYKYTPEAPDTIAAPQMYLSVYPGMVRPYSEDPFS